MKKENSIEILDEYFLRLGDVEKLSFIKVKELYNEMLEITDEVERMNIRDKIVYNVINKLYIHIKNNLLFEFEAGNINKDDVIQDLIISCIEFIDEGQLVNFTSYATFFSQLLYYRLNTKYKNIKYSYDFFNKNFLMLVEWYYNKMNSNGIVVFNDFYSYSKTLDKEVNSSEISNAYNIIESIYSDFEKDDNIAFNNINLLKKFKDIIIQKYLNISCECESIIDDSEISNIENEELEKDLRKVLDCLGDENKYVLSKRIGLDCEIETFDDIAKKLNLAHRAGARGLYISALSRVYKKYNKQLKKLRLIYDGAKSK